ncbi:MAG: hypothetical protein WBC69_20540 [Geitlerinemataceae cyanobacterium]
MIPRFCHEVTIAAKLANTSSEAIAFPEVTWHKHFLRGSSSSKV